jgi:pimeloyl-ACP methyl ester carboxylesterase
MPEFPSGESSLTENRKEMKITSHLPDNSSAPTYLEQGKGHILIMVPGLDGTALLFYRQIPLLARQFHVVTFPLPNDSTCTMESLVENLRLVIQCEIEKHGKQKVLLCGESFGGALSLSLALSHPELLDGLIILNSFPKIRKRFQIAIAPFLLKAMPWGAMPTVRRFTESRLHSPHTLPEDLAEFHERMRSVGKQGYIRRLEILKNYDIRGRLPEIETPTLFLAGDLDQLIPSVAEAKWMASRMPHATVVELKGYGHICLINHDFNLLDYITPWFKAPIAAGGNLG